MSRITPRPVTRTRRAAVVVVVALAMAMVVSGQALATEPQTQTQRETVKDGVRYIESTAKAADKAMAKRDLYYNAGGGGWTVQFKNVISANAGPAEWVRYLYAHTKRLAGAGAYKTNAHATLIEGDSYEDEQVFSVFTHGCAGKTIVNGTAKTCQSPQFSTSPGEKWFVISGHWYDHGNNGSQDATCPGCIDWVWTASAS